MSDLNDGQNENFNKVLGNDSDSDTDMETDLMELMQKYNCIDSQIDNVLQTKYEFDDCSKTPSSSNEEISHFYSLKETLQLNTELAYNPTETSTSQEISQPDLISNILCTKDDLNSNKNKLKKNKVDNSEKLLQKMQKEQQKIEKKAERERIRAENIKAKALKQSVLSAYKNLKPEECIKFVTVFIDSELFAMECGIEIPAILQAANISYKIIAQNLPCTVSWTRKKQTQLETFNEQLELKMVEEDCEECILIMLWKEFVQLTYDKNLSSHIQIKQSVLSNQKIYFCIYGLENYFLYLKQQKSQQSEKQKTTKDNMYKNIPRISRQDVDMALIELQIMCGISHRMLEKPQDVGNVIAQFTKSIAQLPYKQQKQSQYQQLDWFIAGDNKDCVRVNKDGNGLLRLWQQQLTQFTLARLETAEAISSHYPSPLSLMKAYDNCSAREGEKLLQDIPIRRSAGPLTSVRKIGPELSKKVYTLFSSTDGNVFL